MERERDGRVIAHLHKDLPLPRLALSPRNLTHLAQIPHQVQGADRVKERGTYHWGTCTMVCWQSGCPPTPATSQTLHKLAGG